MSFRIIIDARFQSPISLMEALVRLDQVLELCGFFHDKENPDTGISHAYLHRVAKFVPWPNVDRQFQEGEIIDLVYLSRETFGTSYDEGPFPIQLVIMTGNSPLGGSHGFGISTNLWTGSSKRPWWPTAMQLLERVACDLHKEFDCKRTIIRCDNRDDDLNQTEGILFERPI